MAHAFSPEEEEMFRGMHASVGRVGLRQSQPGPALQEETYRLMTRRLELGYITVLEEHAIAMRMGRPAPDTEEQDRQAMFRIQRD